VKRTIPIFNGTIRPGLAPAGFVDKEKDRGIAKNGITICDAVIKEGLMGAG